MATDKFVVEFVSKYSFEKTVDLLIAEAKQRNWNVPAIHDLQQSLAKSGKMVKPVTVIEICKPAYSGNMLELNDERIMSVMMPCRISVYAKDDGKAHIALVDGANMSEGQPENIKKIMKAASDETFEIVRTTVL
ncbi:MAG: DUF302 domain-containing protein [Bacteroidales bacterium]|nr:DUF302 domain-containing protein [Bacteroidales bacterium]